MPGDKKLTGALSAHDANAGAGEDDAQQCEHCSKEFPIEQMTRMSDCWFCEGCYADFKKHFDACEHEWEPHTDEFGDEGKYCSKCSGFVANETQAEPDATPGTFRDGVAPPADAHADLIAALKAHEVLLSEGWTKKSIEKLPEEAQRIFLTSGTPGVSKWLTEKRRAAIAKAERGEAS